MIKFKAFIYRFSAIFGLRIYLAHKEENLYLQTVEKKDEFSVSIHVGLWQAQHGFTTIWNYRKPFHKALIANIKHAFNFRSYDG